MSTVWKARDLVLGRLVAIKRLPPHLAADAVSAARFTREAQAAASLTHPGIVTVYDTGRDDDGPFIVLELIEGETLAARITREGALDVALTADLIGQAAQALDHAHAHGIVHRDIKPANLMIDGDDRLRVTDFGIAQLADETTLTGDNSVLGTLVYMSPEVIDGGPATAASDIYSLGTVAREMLTGRPPFEGDNVGALVTSIRAGDAAPMTGVDPVVAAAVSTAMEPDAGRRYPTAAALATALAGGATIRMDRPAPPPAAPSADDRPTRVLRPTPVSEAASPRSRWRPLVVVGAIALAALLVVAAALDTMRPADAVGSTTTTPAPGTTVAPSTTLPSTTTTTTTPTTTTTTPPTTTPAPASTPEAIAHEIEEMLRDMDEDEFERREVREIEHGLRDVMRAWDRGDEDETIEAFEDELIPAVSDLDESPERQELGEAVVRLAESMGFEVRSSEGGGDDGEDD